MDDLLDGLVDPPYERLVFARCAIVPLARVHGTTPVIQIGVEQSLASGVSAPDGGDRHPACHQAPGRQTAAPYTPMLSGRNAVIVLHQHPARQGAQQVSVYPYTWVISGPARNRRFAPPVLNLGNGSHPPTIVN